MYIYITADSWARCALDRRFLPQRVRTDSGRKEEETYDKSSTSSTLDSLSNPDLEASQNWLPS